MNVPNFTPLVEHLFLDVSLHDVINKIWPVVEPWATMYVDAVREQRFGDAVWARYHMEGGVENGIIYAPPNPTITVLGSIKEDAIGYKTNDPEWYAKALLFYARTSSTDGHPEVIDIIFQADSAEPAEAVNEEDEEDEEDGEDGENEEGDNGEGRDAAGQNQSRSNL
ncbi:hypothetical protein QQZ08_012055 [Neonectria magnoliae]|uniref:Uncharacterized protein n=1 Tax=Neonectria magnoliae TaxID=2732573 RepID=A0ABR1H6Q0_9HYPO